MENAEDFKKVQSEVAAIIMDKILVGHSIEYDMKALFLPHSAEMLRDTSGIAYKTDGKKYSLKELAARELGISFQVRDHSSITSAKRWVGGGGQMLMFAYIVGGWA